MAQPQTRHEKIWNTHVVDRRDDGTCLIYIDRHLVHEVTSPQGFEGVRVAGLKRRQRTRTWVVEQSKTMEVGVEGKLGFGVSARDVGLSISGKIGAAGGTGHVIEYTGDTIRGLSIEGRLTVANMSIEGGARAGLIAPD